MSGVWLVVPAFNKSHANLVVFNPMIIMRICFDQISPGDFCAKNGRLDSFAGRLREEKGRS